MMVNDMDMPQVEDAPEAMTARYDPVTIVLHWCTALLVVTLFGTSLLWNTLPRSAGVGRQLQSLHISLGILLAAVVIGRGLWRLTHGTKLPAANVGIRRLASKLVHASLYGLLTIQIVLGFVVRWTDGESLGFFGLFTIASPLAKNQALQHQLQELHNIAAWALIILAGGHALVALLHHYVMKDGVLRRMLPVS
jgi:cytochrome b561